MGVSSYFSVSTMERKGKKRSKSRSDSRIGGDMAQLREDGLMTLWVTMEAQIEFRGHLGQLSPSGPYPLPHFLSSICPHRIREVIQWNYATITIAGDTIEYPSMCASVDIFKVSGPLVLPFPFQLFWTGHIFPFSGQWYTERGRLWGRPIASIISIWFFSKFVSSIACFQLIHSF